MYECLNAPMKEQPSDVILKKQVGTSIFGILGPFGPDFIMTGKVYHSLIINRNFSKCFT